MLFSVVLNLITLTAVALVLLIIYIGYQQNGTVQNLSQLFLALKKGGIQYPLKAHSTGNIGSFTGAPSAYFDATEADGSSLLELQTAQVPYFADFELT